MSESLSRTPAMVPERRPASCGETLIGSKGVPAPDDAAGLAQLEDGDERDRLPDARKPVDLLVEDEPASG